jgi:small subunit ribosomal protein S3
VWVFKGEILEHDPMAQDRKMHEADNQSTHRPRREDGHGGRDGRDRRDREGGRRGGRDAA